ncbi:MAG: hypothetical protein EZS28_031629, partial [Streblomastix strix]
MRRIAEVFVGEMKDGTTSEGISDATGRSSSAQVLPKKNPRSQSSNTLTGHEEQYSGSGQQLNKNKNSTIKKAAIMKSVISDEELESNVSDDLEVFITSQSSTPDSSSLSSSYCSSSENSFSEEDFEPTPSIPDIIMSKLEFSSDDSVQSPLPKETGTDESGGTTL